MLQNGESLIAEAGLIMNTMMMMIIIIKWLNSATSNPIPLLTGIQ